MLEPALPRSRVVLKIGSVAGLQVVYVQSTAQFSAIL